MISRDVYEVVALAAGKRETSTLLGIGTPGPDPHDSVLSDLRAYAAEHPDDPSLRLARVLRCRVPAITRSTARTAGSWRTRRWTTSCTATR